MSNNIKSLKKIKNNFSQTFLTKNNGEKNVIKIINIDKLTQFQIKEVSDDIEKIKKIKHLNLIEYKNLNIDIEKKKIYMETEFYEGDTLLEKLLSKYSSFIDVLSKKFEEKEIFEYLYKICLGLYEYHKNGLIHRNIKPSNIFFTKENELKIGYFSLDKILLSKYEIILTDISKSPDNSFIYLPPDFFYKRKYTYKNDSWSIGILIYEMCKLEKPKDYNEVNKILKTKNLGLDKKYNKFSKIISSLLEENESRRLSIKDILNLLNKNATSIININKILNNVELYQKKKKNENNNLNNFKKNVEKIEKFNNNIKSSSSTSLDKNFDKNNNEEDNDNNNKNITQLQNKFEDMKKKLEDDKKNLELKIEELKKVNENIKIENDKLKKENDKLKIENNDLKNNQKKNNNNNENLNKEINILKDKIKKLEKENYELKNKSIYNIINKKKYKNPVILSSKNGLFGLVNLGNTCYMNSCLQCLLHTDKLISKFFTEESSTIGDLSLSLYNLICKIRNEDSKIINPNIFFNEFCKKSNEFNDGNQHDSFQFLTSLINNLNEEIKPKEDDIIDNDDEDYLEDKRDDETDEEAYKRFLKFYKKDNNFFIFDLFNGMFKKTTKCLKCKKEKVSFQPFTFLELNIDKKNTIEKLKKIDNSYYSNNINNNNIRLEDLIELFLQEEKIDDLCNFCKKKSIFTLKTDIYKEPKNLIIKLQRFLSFNSNEKLDTKIEFPIDLNIEKYIISKNDNFIFKLYGIIIHEGNLNNGHYYSFCKNNVYDDNWYKFNDQQVEEVEEFEILNEENYKNAYVLFYKKQII